MEDLIQHSTAGPASEAELQSLRWLNRRRVRSIRRHEEAARRWDALAQMAVHTSLDNLQCDGLSFDNRTLALLVGKVCQLAVRKSPVS